MGWVIIANGRPNEKGVMDAVSRGASLLDEGFSALDAVEATIRIMEDNPVFDAGTGCDINLYGQILMDASIIDGNSLDAGAVGVVRGVKNPISLARKVMEKTPNVLLVGDGANEFANVMAEIDDSIVVGYDARTQITKNRFKKAIEILAKEGLLYDILSEEDGASHARSICRLAIEGKLVPIRKLIKASTSGTVSTAALDTNGNFAAGASTGGWTLNIPGRIGDSPLIGCGAYADNEAGASSTSSIRGENNMKLGGLTRKICDLMREDMPAQEATELVTEYAKRRLGLTINRGSLIAIDKEGRTGFNCAHKAESQGVGLWKQGEEFPTYHEWT